MYMRPASEGVGFGAPHCTLRAVTSLIVVVVAIASLLGGAARVNSDPTGIVAAFSHIRRIQAATSLVFALWE